MGEAVAQQARRHPRLARCRRDDRAPPKLTVELVYLSGGSNVRPEHHLSLAARELKRSFPGTRFSRCYRNVAIGFEGPDFINFAAELPVHDAPDAVRAELQRIESVCGREPGAPRWAPRSMDLDVLLFGDRVLQEPGLVVPRPDLLKRAFMLGPLAELAPGVVHPTSRRTLAELWDAFDRAAHPLIAVDLDLAAA
ncbi:2-amino-4-hydroxy-6-hydroxymethyldihydropteridine diphosphokinase [bacterium]|nr:MAG: 2-amino-4-hydroxy-6-hydroxymethyldihydropteridine diphosphokinase [bacterium]